MPSFADSIFLFILALLLFGPKKLPVLARELGKWVGEFRRASNEFKMQMEEELRASEQADRQKQIAAMEAAAPVAPPLEEPDHPHLKRSVVVTESAAAEPVLAPPGSMAGSTQTHEAEALPAAEPGISPPSPEARMDGVRPIPIPIATSGSLHMMPPATGLPTPRPRNVNPVSDLLDAVPEQAPASTFAQETPEPAAHGD